MSETKTIETGRATLLAVNMEYVPMINGEIIYHKLSKMVYDAGFQDIDYTIIALSTEITEEQARGLVPFIGLPWCAYKDYTTNKNWYRTAKESFNSFMKANQCYSTNPYKEDWDELCKWGHGGFAKDGKTEFELFTEAESNTGNWIVLKRL